MRMTHLAAWWQIAELIAAIIVTIAIAKIMWSNLQQFVALTVLLIMVFIGVLYCDYLIIKSLIGM